MLLFCVLRVLGLFASAASPNLCGPLGSTRDPKPLRARGILTLAVSGKALLHSVSLTLGLPRKLMSGAVCFSGTEETAAHVPTRDPARMAAICMQDKISAPCQGQPKNLVTWLLLTSDPISCPSPCPPKPAPGSVHPSASLSLPPAQGSSFCLQFSSIWLSLNFQMSAQMSPPPPS